MNLFYVHEDPFKAARMLCDKHIVKMPLEKGQMLSTAHRHLDGDEWADSVGLYKVAHLNHPTTMWVRSSADHYQFAVQYFEALLLEKLRRYPDNPPHKSGELLEFLQYLPDNIPYEGFVPPPQCMPDEYKHKNTVTAYRNYYRGAKAHIARWKQPATKPTWFKE